MSLDSLLHPHANSNLVELLLHRTQHHSEKLAYRFLSDGETESACLSYQQLGTQACAIAAYLQTLTTAGERVLLLFPPGLEFITTFLGCLCAQMVAVPAYPSRRNLRLERMMAIARDAEPSLVLTTHSLLEQVRLQFQALEIGHIRCIAIDPLASEWAAVWQPIKISPDTLAFLQYTSGSTGQPKGVKVSHGNLLYNQQMIELAFQHDTKTVVVGWLPLFHDMGLIGNVLQPLYLGIPCILMPPAAFLQKPLRWLQAISRYRATTSGGPNFAYDLCIKHITPKQKASLDLSCWTVAFNGAEPIRAETLQRFSEAFADCGFRAEAFYPCYGMAETTLLVSGGLKRAKPMIHRVDRAALEQNQVVAAAGSSKAAWAIVGCGRSPNAQKIVIAYPDSLTQCPNGRVGEIWVSGANVATGYWRKQRETEETFNAYLVDTGEGPFLRTGDLGFLLNDELFVTGRIKDVIIIRGQNHYPQDIEKTVQDCHPALHTGSGAAFSISLDSQEKLVVVQEIERQHLRRLNTQEVINAIRKAISEHHGLQVHEVVLIRPSSIPKTSSGKIQRHVCRGAWLNETLPVVARFSDELIAFSKNIHSLPWQQPLSLGSPPEEDASSVPIVDIRHLESWLVSRLALHLKIKPEDLDLDEPLSIYGLDSFCAVRITGELAERFNIVVEPTLVSDYPTIRGIAEYLVDRLGSAHSTSDTPSATEIDSSVSQIDSWPEYLQLKERLEQLNFTGNPFFKIHHGIAGNLTQVDGKTLINYASYNYLGLSGDPNVSKIAQQAIDDYGTSVSASRVISGEIPLHAELEREIADFIGVEGCITFVGGHATNVTTIGHLLRPKDLIIYDSLSHNSIQEGCQLSGAEGIQFSHNDCRHLERILQDSRHRYDRVLIVVEGVYSADGDVAPLPRLVELKQQYHCLLMVDEAHSMGILGASGRGVSEQFQINPTHVDLWMGTLSKSFASCGGYIAGSAALTTYLKYTTPGFVFSVGLSPANTAASLAAIRLLKAEPQRVEILHKRTQLLRRLLLEQGFNIGLSQDSAIIPVIVGESEKAIQLSQAMFSAGINVAPMIYPSVGRNAARLRFFVSTLHTEAQIHLTVHTLLEQWCKLHDENPLFWSGLKT